MGSFPRTNSNHQINNINDDDVDALFSPLSVRGTLLRSAGILWDNLALFLTMSAVVIVPLVLILVVAIYTIAWEMQGTAAMSSPFFLEFVILHARPLSLLLLFVMAVYIFVGNAIQAAMMRVVAEVYTGKRPCELQQDLMEYLRHYGLQSKRLVCSIFCYNCLLHVGILSLAICLEIILTILLILLEFIILGNDIYTTSWKIVAWIFHLIRLCLVSMASIHINVSMFATIPSMVVEDSAGRFGLFRAMGRSWDLVTTRRWFVFAALALYAVTVWLPCMIFGIVILATFGVAMTSIPWSLLIIIVMTPISLVLLPFHAIFQAVLYLNVRIEKEGCRQSVLVREIDALVAAAAGQGNRSSDATMTTDNMNESLSSSAGLYTPIFMTDDSLTVNDADNNNNNDNNVNNDDNKALLGAAMNKDGGASVNQHDYI